MLDLKVGMYVRTDLETIGKIKSLRLNNPKRDYDKNNNRWIVKTDNEDLMYDDVYDPIEGFPYVAECDEMQIKKADYELIKLIREDDFINRKKVYRINDELFIRNAKIDENIKDISIKSIWTTGGMFTGNKYRVKK